LIWPRVLVVVVLLILAAAVARWLPLGGGGAGPEPPKRRIAAAAFACDGGKTVDATFYAGTSKPAAGARPPAPGGGVHLELSDGRELDLLQTVSADGARYADARESLVFWNRGNGAFVLENGRQTYTGCIVVAPDPGGLPNVYESGEAGFSMRYPAGYMVDAEYEYQGLGPDKSIGGVKFRIADSIAAGTNLASDSYLSVEQMPRGEACTASRFLAPAPAATAVTDGGATYSVARSTEAAAGNRYEESVYALLGTNPCVAVRYFIHYGVLQNYPAGAVRGFDRAALLSQLDAMRRTLIVRH
jgi:membrane-bound inhibitor of C-type lysozyme